MAEDSKLSTTKQEELTEEGNQTKSSYETLLEDNLSIEKGLRAKKFKIETQLASWLAKYDTDIGERHAEYEELLKK